jgi:hypothetical protein
MQLTRLKESEKYRELREQLLGSARDRVASGLRVE